MKKEIKKIAEETKLADQTFVSKVISDELKAANVKIKDDAFKNALAGYMQTESSSASSEKKNQNQVILKQAIPKQATLKKQQILQAKQQNLLLNKHKREWSIDHSLFIYLLEHRNCGYLNQRFVPYTPQAVFDELPLASFEWTHPWYQFDVRFPLP